MFHLLFRKLFQWKEFQFNQYSTTLTVYLLPFRCFNLNLQIIALYEHQITKTRICIECYESLHPKARLIFECKMHFHFISILHVVRVSCYRCESDLLEYQPAYDCLDSIKYCM